jgi:hypothetical protein
MSMPMNDTLTAIGRQLSIAYLPTLAEPLPRELQDLLAQLVAFEMRERGPSTEPGKALQFAIARVATSSALDEPSAEQQSKQTGSP